MEFSIFPLAASNRTIIVIKSVKKNFQIERDEQKLEAVPIQLEKKDISVGVTVLGRSVRLEKESVENLKFFSFFQIK